LFGIGANDVVVQQEGRMTLAVAPAYWNLMSIATGTGEMALQSAGASPYDGLSPGSERPFMDESAVPRVAGTDPASLASDRDLETTFDLLERIKAGDMEARERLFARVLPQLRRWASGRLPRWARDLRNTDDLVQETVIRALKRIESFEARHEGALLAYLRQAIVNLIRDEIRHRIRSPLATALDETHADLNASPLDEAIGQEAVERYDAALKRLRPEHREAIVLRVEMECSYQEIARMLGKSSPDAARMAVTRALLSLAQEMNRGA
jgi:RNA polymerase sigma-70 factor (ECF subfamily)